MYITHTPDRVAVKGYKRDDCTVIAIGNSLGLSYDLSRKILQTGNYRNGTFTFRKRSPRTKNEFILQRHVQMICEALSVQTTKFETSNMKKRTSLGEFAKENNKGTYIALVDSHLSTVIDGKVIDAWDSRERKMIAAYKVDIDKAHEVIYELAKHYRMTSDKHFIKKHKQEILSQAVAW